MIKTTYSLHSLTDEGNDSSALADGIALYGQNVSAHDRTNTNEIVYWLGRYKDEHGDDFECFSFYRNYICVGFAELVYFSSERIVVLDYITLKKEFKRNNIFYELFEHVRSHFAIKNREVDYWIFEVFHSGADGNPSPSDFVLMDMLRLQGFKEVHAKYIVPSLGVDNPQSAMNGSLMLYTESNLPYIKRQLFSNIVKTIYIKHYKRWYVPFLGEKIDSYSSDLEKKMHLIVDSIENDNIPINGYKARVEYHPPLESSPPQLGGFVARSLIIIGLSVALIVGAVRYAQQSIYTVVSAVAISLITYFSLLAVIHSNASRVFKELIKDINPFRNKK